MDNMNEQIEAARRKKEEARKAAEEEVQVANKFLGARVTEKRKKAAEEVAERLNRHSRGDRKITTSRMIRALFLVLADENGPLSDEKIIKWVNEYT